MLKLLDAICTDARSGRSQRISPRLAAKCSPLPINLTQCSLDFRPCSAERTLYETTKLCLVISCNGSFEARALDALSCEIIPMRTPRTSPLHLVPCAAGGISRLVCARLRAAGLEPEALLSAAGLNSKQMDDPHSRIDVKAQINLLNIAADALKDDFLGFHLAREFEPREVGLIHYVIASSSTLAEAMSKTERYCRLVNEGIAVRFKVNHSTVIALDSMDFERQSDRHQIEFWAFGMVRACRLLTGTRIAPLQLRLMHVRDVTPNEFRSFLGCDVEFGANSDEIILPKATAVLPLVNGDIHLNKLLTAYAEEALAHRKPHAANVRLKVERAIAPLLPHGTATGSEVARELGVSRRTLARLLSAEGHTFSGILQQFRLDLAKAYISHDDLSISEIAWLLGYGEVSAFTHAFRRWTGATPREMRAAHRLNC